MVFAVDCATESASRNLVSNAIFESVNASSKPFSSVSSNQLSMPLEMALTLNENNSNKGKTDKPPKSKASLAVSLAPTRLVLIPLINMNK